MSDKNMTQDQFQQIMNRFEKIEGRFEKIDSRMEHMVTKSDVHTAVFQGLAFASAAIVGTVVVLNAVGAFS